MMYFTQFALFSIIFSVAVDAIPATSNANHGLTAHQSRDRPPPPLCGSQQCLYSQICLPVGNSGGKQCYYVGAP